MRNSLLALHASLLVRLVLASEVHGEPGPESPDHLRRDLLALVELALVLALALVSVSVELALVETAIRSHASEPMEAGAPCLRSEAYGQISYRPDR